MSVTRLPFGPPECRPVASMQKSVDRQPRLQPRGCHIQTPGEAAFAEMRQGRLSARGEVRLQLACCLFKGARVTRGQRRKGTVNWGNTSQRRKMEPSPSLYQVAVNYPLPQPSSGFKSRISTSRLLQPSLSCGRIYYISILRSTNRPQNMTLIRNDLAIATDLVDKGIRIDLSATHRTISSYLPNSPSSSRLSTTKPHNSALHGTANSNTQTRDKRRVLVHSHSLRHPLTTDQAK